MIMIFLTETPPPMSERPFLELSAWVGVAVSRNGFGKHHERASNCIWLDSLLGMPCREVCHVRRSVADRDTDPLQSNFAFERLNWIEKERDNSL